MSKLERSRNQRGDRREMARANALLAVVFLICYCCCCGALTQIPAKYDGFMYGKATDKVWRDSVMVEAFLDPMCPDSRDSWPPLKRAVQYYSSRVSLIVHPYPLPYHSNSYVACRALHIANKLNSSTIYPLLELFFKYQGNYFNAPSYHKSEAYIVGQLSKLAVVAVGKNLHSAFLAGFNDSRTDSAARISFTCGCSRGVSTAPFFFVNGIPLPNYGKKLDFKKWRSIIDPLFAKQ